MCEEDIADYKQQKWSGFKKPKITPIKNKIEKSECEKVDSKQPKKPKVNKNLTNKRTTIKTSVPNQSDPNSSKLPPCKKNTLPTKTYSLRKRKKILFDFAQIRKSPLKNTKKKINKTLELKRAKVNSKNISTDEWEYPEQLQDSEKILIKKTKRIWVDSDHNEENNIEGKNWKNSDIFLGFSLIFFLSNLLNIEF